MGKKTSKENFVNIRMSDEMLEILDQLTEIYYLDRSRLIRRLIREEAERKPNIEVPKKVLYEST